MIKCSKCGAELSDDTKFCSYCGNKIESTTPPPIKEDTTIPDVPLNEPDKANAKKSDAPKSLVNKMKDKASEKWHRLSVYGKNHNDSDHCVHLVVPCGVLIWKDCGWYHCNYTNCSDGGCGTDEEANHQNP